MVFILSRCPGSTDFHGSQYEFSSHISLFCVRQSDGGVTSQQRSACINKNHYNDIIWASCRLKPSATRLFVQHIFQPNNNENITALHCLPLWGNHRWLRVFHYKGPVMRKNGVYVMTLSCSVCSLPRAIKWGVCWWWSVLGYQQCLSERSLYVSIRLLWRQGYMW